MTSNDKRIKFHDDIAIADTAFTVKGRTVDELFEYSAIALISSMADISKIDIKEKREFTLESNNLDTLLFDFLSEILFYKDSDNLLFSEFEIDVKKQGKQWYLKAEIGGELANPNKHKVTIDIKAITMHMFKLEKTREGYEARVVIDI
ncbi:archease [Candidatus Dojkabacteria bacterium]|nr:archease [Candidatus Dojkabacteria bacterium]